MRPDVRGLGVVPLADVRPSGAYAKPSEHDDPELRPVGSGVYGLRAAVPTAPLSGRKVFGSVVVASMLFPLLLAMGGATCGALLEDQAGVRRVARADRFASQTLAALAALPFETVQGLDGRAWHDRGAPELSEFSVELQVQPAGEGLLRVDGVLKDATTRIAIAQLTTVRERR